LADPLEEKIQLILDKYQEITAPAGEAEGGIVLDLVFGNLARDQNDAWPRVSWVEIGGEFTAPRGASGDVEAEAAAMWANLEVLVWDQTAELARNACFNLIAASRKAIDAPDIDWKAGYERGEDRHKNDGVEFKLSCRIRLPVPLYGTRGPLTAQVLHHTGTYSPDTSVNVAGDAYEQLAWVADNSGTTARLHGFSASQLEESAEAAAARVVTVSHAGIGTRTLTGCIFDGSGNLWCWTAGVEPIHIFRVTPAQLLTTGTVTPGIILTMPTKGDGRATNAVRARFDRAGNLWVLTAGNYLWRVNAADTGATGTPTPGVEIEFSGHGGDPTDFLFDLNENMIVSFYGADASTPSALFKVTPAERSASSAALAPAVKIGGTGSGNRRGYGGLALARDGKVWVTSRDVGAIENNRLLAYAPAAFESSAPDPAPFYQLYPTWEGDIDSPLGVEFDQFGDLWFTGTDADLNRLHQSKLQTGSVTPDIQLTASIAGASRFAFQTLAL
jgi:hypothetical protein